MQIYEDFLEIGNSLTSVLVRNINEVWLTLALDRPLIQTAPNCFLSDHCLRKTDSLLTINTNSAFEVRAVSKGLVYKHLWRKTKPKFLSS